MSTPSCAGWPAACDCHGRSRMAEGPRCPSTCRTAVCTMRTHSSRTGTSFTSSPGSRRGPKWRATDSYFVRGGYTERGFDLQVSHRSVRRDDPGEDSALVASYIFRGGVMLQAGLRAFESLDDSGRWRLLAVRVPIARTLDVTLEDNRTVGGRSEDVSHAVTFQLLRGPVRLTQRYQWGDIEYARVGDPYGLDQRQLQTAGSYSPTRWATVGLQSATQWLPDGRARQWQELHAALTLSRRSSLQVYASFPESAGQHAVQGTIRAGVAATVLAADGLRESLGLSDDGPAG